MNVQAEGISKEVVVAYFATLFMNCCSLLYYAANDTEAELCSFLHLKLK
jgi:hypothetical protein